MKAQNALLERIERLYELDGIEDEPILRGIRVALNPDDSKALVEHAKSLLNLQTIGANDPFLPAAIEATQESDPATARELASALVERRPNDEAAVRTYIRAAVATAAPEEIHQALQDRIRPDSTAIDLLWWRAASAICRQEDDWPRWLSKVVEQVRLKTNSYGIVRAAITRSESFVPEHVRYLGGAVFALAADQWDAAQAELDDWKLPPRLRPPLLRSSSPPVPRSKRSNILVYTASLRRLTIYFR